LDITQLNAHFGLPGVLAFHATPSGLIYAGIAPQRFVDSRFIRDLVASGFIDSLYKGR